MSFFKKSMKLSI